ncbi:MAG: diacylglycerol/lipid kinase family protein [Candidatus Hodarchaeales archaeon]|jgi:YegS/Rv2252/BmrU family lipid kinase
MKNNKTENLSFEAFNMKELFLIVNPTAGGGRVSKIWIDEVKPLLNEHEVEYDFEMTTHHQHAIEIARTRVDEGYKMICSVGGDGTANEIINGILKADKEAIFTAFAIGTGNDIPTVFGLPEMDVEATVDCLINGKEKNFDLGYCNKADRYFVSVASMGFDAEVAERSNKRSKRLKGTSYQIAIVETILRFKPYNLIITPDDGTPIEAKRMLLAIGNGKRYGAGMHICPDADPTDGKFNVTTLRKISRISLLRLFPLTYDGKHIKNKKVDTFEGRKFDVESIDKECLYQVDGEILGYLPETFVTKPNAITVRVPEPWISYSEIWREKLNKKKKKK